MKSFSYSKKFKDSYETLCRNSIAVIYLKESLTKQKKLMFKITLNVLLFFVVSLKVSINVEQSTLSNNEYLQQMLWQMNATITLSCTMQKSHLTT